ncbi:helix-turn-helix domain-containing protein [Kocuria sp. M1R5S2]|uniref:helix-turn-helix domain-containing protein n=1 Tax=Kocuria rhizosphaerae TaxID=3376285 RepID=UPI0037ADC0FD
MKNEAIILAVVTGTMSRAEAARRFQVSRSRVSKLVARYRAVGEAAFTPGSRAAHHHPNAVPDPAVEAILATRRALVAAGHDACQTTPGQLPQPHRGPAYGHPPLAPPPGGGSAPTASTRPAASPCACTRDCTTSASGGPTPEPP